MTTAALSRLGARAPLGPAAAVAGFAVWAVAAGALWLDLVVLTVPRANLVESAVVYGLPIAVAVLAIVRRGQPSTHLALLAGAMCAVAGAAWVTPQLPARGSAVLALPALVATALLTRRFPVPAIVGLFACSAFYGSAQAFFELPLGQVADVLFGGLWVGLIAGFFTQARRVPFALSPGVVVMGLYVLATLAAVALAADVNFALKVFRFSTWHLLGFVLVAYLALRPSSLEAIARGAVLVALVAGAYATLRWSIGAAEQEQALLNGGAGVMYNQIAPGEDKVQGSFPNGQELGLWASLMIPFCMAAVLTWKGAFRIVALAAVPLLAIGLLGSGQRTGFIAAVAGTLAVVVLNQLARGFRGPRLGVAVGALLSLIVAGAVIFPAVVDSPEKVQRYESILTPSRDGPFQERLYKWENALADVEGHPFGRGIGTGGPASQAQRFPGKASDNVDSSYIQIAYEQGFVVMLLFIFALLVLLFELIRHTVWTRSRREATMTLGAAGTLCALGLSLAGNLHLNSMAITAGWLVIGLGVAQYAARRADDAEPAPSH